MVEGWLKDVGRMLKDIGRMLEGCWRIFEGWWKNGDEDEGYWKNVGRIFEGCWKNGNEDDNENEVYEGLRWALLSGWLESEMIDFGWIRGFDKEQTNGWTFVIVELLSRLWLKGVGKMLKDIGRILEEWWWG